MSDDTTPVSSTLGSMDIKQIIGLQLASFSDGPPNAEVLEGRFALVMLGPGGTCFTVDEAGVVGGDPAAVKRAIEARLSKGDVSGIIRLYHVALGLICDRFIQP